MLCCCQLEILDNFIFEPVFHKRSQMQNWSMLFEPEVPYFLFYNRPSKLSSQSWPWTWSRWLRWVLQKTESALWSALSTRAKALTQSRHDDDHSKTHGGFSEPVLGSLYFYRNINLRKHSESFLQMKAYYSDHSNTAIIFISRQRLLQSFLKPGTPSPFPLTPEGVIHNTAPHWALCCNSADMTRWLTGWLQEAPLSSRKLCLPPLGLRGTVLKQSLFQLSAAKKAQTAGWGASPLHFPSVHLESKWNKCLLFKCLFSLITFYWEHSTCGVSLKMEMEEWNEGKLDLLNRLIYVQFYEINYFKFDFSTEETRRVPGR